MGALAGFEKEIDGGKEGTPQAKAHREKSGKKPDDFSKKLWYDSRIKILSEPGGPLAVRGPPSLPESGHIKKRSSDMEIRRVPVSKLNPAAYNPRKDLQPGDAEYQRLARSLDKFRSGRASCRERVLLIV